MSDHQRPKPITLYDVAERCGVSYQTVSRVINGHPHVSKATRQRVLQAIEALDYRPNRAAQSLVTRRSFTLGVVTFGAAYYGPLQMVGNVARIAKARGYNLLVANISDTAPEDVQDAIHTFSGKLVDGIITITPVASITSVELRALCGDTPFVQVDTQLGANEASVVIDQHYGAKLAVQHLIDLGHVQISEISGPLHWFDAAARHEGWLDTLNAAGLQTSATLEGDWTAAGGYAAACRLLNEGAAFTALFVGNDQMALGALRALREHGLRVPEDISIVGFDDIPEAAFYEPPLTTIQQDFSALGRQSVEYLVELIDQRDSPNPAPNLVHQRVLYPRFIERQSTDVPTTAPR